MPQAGSDPVAAVRLGLHQLSQSQTLRGRLLLVTDNLTTARAGASPLSSIRITSYNVCYTKLLRPVAAFREAGIRLVVASDANPGTAPTESLPLAMAFAVRSS